MYYVLLLLRMGLIPDSRFEYSKKNSSAEFSVEEFSFIPFSLPLVVVDVFRFPFVFGRGAFCRIAYGDDVEGDDA